jgi:hypothetical protein
MGDCCQGQLVVAEWWWCFRHHSSTMVQAQEIANRSTIPSP